MEVDVWPPLAGFGADAITIERALASEPSSAVAATIGSANGTRGARLAAEVALRVRSGEDPTTTSILARRAEEALAAEGDRRGAAFVAVERAVVIAADRARLDEAAAITSALLLRDDDPALSAAILRASGAIARTRGDLRGSLASLERARRLADRSGSVREIVRAENTLGTTYASLGVASLARVSLERAREIAEVSRQRQSAAVAAGQLAVVAFESGDLRLAARHLRFQESTSEFLSDVHGRARAAALLASVHATESDLVATRAAAERARSIQAEKPTPWTRLQALLATIAEAESAIASGDEVRGAELVDAIEAELASDDSNLRVARARCCFVRLASLRRDERRDGARGVADALALLRSSPRPTWVEAALVASCRIARTSGDETLARRLAVRASAVLEARAAAASRSLPALRDVAEEEAIARASALGRDLVHVARLALAPFDPFDAFVAYLPHASPGAVDAAVAAAEAAARSDTMLVQIDRSGAALLALSEKDAAERAEAALATPFSVRRVAIVEDPTIGLSLVAI